MSGKSVYEPVHDNLCAVSIASSTERLTSLAFACFLSDHACLLIVLLGWDIVAGGTVDVAEVA